MRPLRRWRPSLAAILLSSIAAACSRTGAMPEFKQPGIFTQSDGYLVEIRKLGTLGQSYGPRLYPDLPEYDIPVVSDVGPIYVNHVDVPIASLKGIEWHGYRLGGNGSVGSPSTATPHDWKLVPIVTEPTETAGVVRIRVAAADPKTGRWKPESNHEYFGLMVDTGYSYKGGPIWAVKIK